MAAGVTVLILLPWFEGYVFVTREHGEEAVVIQLGTWDHPEKIRFLRDNMPMEPEISPNPYGPYLEPYAPHPVPDSFRAINVWYYDCQMLSEYKSKHMPEMWVGAVRPVRPPWVPRWVVNWTLLAHIVPDYVEHC